MFIGCRISYPICITYVWYLWWSSRWSWDPQHPIHDGGKTWTSSRNHQPGKLVNTFPWNSQILLVNPFLFLLLRRYFHQFIVFNPNLEKQQHELQIPAKDSSPLAPLNRNLSWISHISTLLLMKPCFCCLKSIYFCRWNTTFSWSLWCSTDVLQVKSGVFQQMVGYPGYPRVPQWTIAGGFSWKSQEAWREILEALQLPVVTAEGLQTFFQFQRAQKGTVLWTVGDELLGGFFMGLDRLWMTGEKPIGFQGMGYMHAIFSARIMDGIWMEFTEFKEYMGYRWKMFCIILFNGMWLGLTNGGFRSHGGSPDRPCGWPV